MKKGIGSSQDEQENSLTTPHSSNDVLFSSLLRRIACSLSHVHGAFLCFLSAVYASVCPWRQSSARKSVFPSSCPLPPVNACLLLLLLLLLLRSVPVLLCHMQVLLCAAGGCCPHGQARCCLSARAPLPSMPHDIVAGTMPGLPGYAQVNKTTTRGREGRAWRGYYYHAQHILTSPGN